MFFSRVVASFFAFGVLSAAAAPAPVAVEKRQSATDVLAIVNTLQTATAGILPQIDGLVNSNEATQANLSPLLDELTGVLGTGTSALTLLGPISASDPIQNEIAGIVSSITEDIAATLENIQTNAPGLYFLVPLLGVQAALYNLLQALANVITGILNLISGLLNGLAGLLSGLGFTLILLLLGLL